MAIIGHGMGDRDTWTQPGTFEVVQHGNHVASVDRQPASQFGLAGRTVFVERD